jgi:hypothetical protein
LRRCAHLFEEQNTLTSVIIVFITLCAITDDNHIHSPQSDAFQMRSEAA